MSNQVSVLVYSRRVGSPVRKAVLVYFAERASDNGEGVWASKPTIAAAIECGRSTVIRAINDFVKEGILREVGKRSCRGGATTEYAMNLPAIASLPAACGDDKNTETRPAAGPVPERDPSQSGTKPVPQRDPHPSRSGTQTTIGTISNHHNTGRTAQTSKAENDAAFAAFWAVYPKKVAKPAARKNWDRAIRAGADPAAIIAGAERYAKSDGVARGFVKHPQGWLTDERWTDEQPTPQQIQKPTDDSDGRRAFLRRVGQVARTTE